MVAYWGLGMLAVEEGREGGFCVWRGGLIRVGDLALGEGV